MKKTPLFITSLFVAFLPNGQSFAPQHRSSHAAFSKHKTRRLSDLPVPRYVLTGSPLKATADGSPLQDAIEERNLRKATSVLKNDDKVNLSRDQWNQIFELIEERTANADENSENLRQATEFPTESAARSEMTQMYNVLKESGQLKLFGAVDPRVPLAAGSTNVPPPLMEGIIDLPMTALTPQPNNSLLFAGVAVALLEFIASAAFQIPMNTLALSSLLLVALDRLFLNGATFETFLKFFSPGVQEKILRHEAGHFLAAYLLGCPVEGIVLSAWGALQDRRFGTRQVSAGTSFFDPELSQQINNRKSVTRSAVDRYSIIVMAGIAAEADNYGRADGGAGDEMSLVAFLSQLNAGTSGSWNSDTIRNQARWGALQAVLMMREYKPAYDALVDALERGGTLGDCIFAIEKAARDAGLGPVKHPNGFIVEDTVQENDSLMVQKVVWKKYKETMDGESFSTESSTSVVDPPGSLVEGQRTSADKARIDSEENPAKAVDEKELSETLRRYREQAENRLRSIEEELNQLD